MEVIVSILCFAFALCKCTLLIGTTNFGISLDFSIFSFSVVKLSLMLKMLN